MSISSFKNIAAINSYKHELPINETTKIICRIIWNKVQLLTNQRAPFMLHFQISLEITLICELTSREFKIEHKRCLSFWILINMTFTIWVFNFKTNRWQTIWFLFSQESGSQCRTLGKWWDWGGQWGWEWRYITNLQKFWFICSNVDWKIYQIPFYSMHHHFLKQISL